MRLRTAATLLSIIGVSCIMLRVRAHDKDYDDDQRKSNEVKKIIADGSTKYSKFWGWMTDWQMRSDATVAQQARTNKQCGAQIIKRKACQDSTETKFHDDVEDIWEDLIESLTQRAWGIIQNRRDSKNYGGWKNVATSCANGTYKDSNSLNCQPCPRGCSSCKAQDKCLSCKKNYTFVEGYNFGYCMPDCQKGKFQQHLYTDDQSFCKKLNLTQRPQTLTTTQLNAHCVKCPTFCDDCVFNEVTGKAFCHQSRKGFQFNENKGECQANTNCQTGQYKVKELAKNQVLTESTPNVEDYICKDCKPGCASCSNNSTCSTCKPGYLLYSVSNTNKTCLKCPDNCQTCAVGDKGQTICKACIPKYYPFNNGTQCIMNKTCSPGKWFNDVRLACQQCPSNCLTCKQGSKNGTSVCLTCTADMKLNSTVCVEKCNSQKEFFNRKNSSCTKCPFGQYPDKSNQKCRPCTYKNCVDCIFKQSPLQFFGQEECSSCKNDFWFDTKMRMCKTQCNSSSIFDFYSQSCRPCTIGYYKNAMDDTCRPCSSSCQSCELPQNSTKPICKTCKSAGHKVDEVDKGVCRQNCKSDQYIDAQGWQCKVCPSGKYVTEDSRGCGMCPKYCVGCNKNLTSKKLECTKCDSWATFDKNSKRCIPTCKPSIFQYYIETETCRQCPPYQSYSSRTKKCEPCNSKNCLDCVHTLSNKTLPQCSSCDGATKMDFKTQTCRVVCNSTTFYNNFTNTCDQCPQKYLYNATTKKCKPCNITNCHLCQTAGTSCETCNYGFLLDSASGKCIRNCSENYYFSQFDQKCVTCSAGQYYNSALKLCVGCPNSCIECKTVNNQLNCSQCQSGHILDSANNVCRQACNSSAPIYNSTLQKCVICPLSTYFSQGQCIQCPSNCSSCNFNALTNKTVCQSCSNGWIIDDQAKLCKPTCPANQQYDFVLNKCNQCPTGQAVNTTTQVCKPCPTNCTSCIYDSTSKSMQCTTCVAGQEVDQMKKICRASCNSTQYYSSSTNQCMSCQAGQYLNTTTISCQICPTNCASCAFNNQTKLAECLTCKTGSIFDLNQNLCKLNCSLTQYYNWDTKQCNSCTVGTYMNPKIESCQACPDGCATCSYNYLDQYVDCQSCLSTAYVIDSSQQLCREKCNSTAYYDWSALACINCEDDEFLEPKSQSCQRCPSNCQSCFFNSSSQLECTTCSDNFTLQRQTCIEVCNSTTYYDWVVGACQECPDGQWLNPNTKKCEFCTLGCNICEVDDVNTQTSQCLECLPTLVLDKEKCRKPCEANQFFNWNSFSCTDCSYPCTSCSDSQICTGCDEMFIHSPTEGVCTNKCNPITQIWNSVTKQCDQLRKFNLTVTAASNRVWRCRNTTLSTVGSGFTSTEVPTYTWSFEIVQGGWNKNNWLADINQLLITANSNKAQSIIISNTFTEKVTDNTTIKFIVSLNVNGQITTNYTNLIVDRYVYLSIGNYSKSYQLWSADGLPLYPAFYFPECPVFKGPQAIPANVSIACSLYDSKSNLIKALPYCQIQKTELTPGLTYYIKYYYAPNPIQTGATNGLRDTITVYAYAQLPACTIINSTQIYVRKTDNLYLNTAIINGKSTFVYKWSCNSLTTGGLCGISQTTQITADLSLPGSSLTQGSIYNFTMNMLENTVFQAACSARVEVVSSTQVAITVGMIDQANSWNYFDPSSNQAIQCYQYTETNASLSYDWKVVRKSTQASIYKTGSPSTSGFSQSGSSLTIVGGTFVADSYDITCTAQNLKYKGTTTKTYSTSPILPITLQLDISPSTGGIAQSTTYSITATKPSGYNLWCYFGQMTSDNQEIRLYDSSDITYSNAAQTLLTQLDRVILQDTQQVFINCYDDSGSYARTVKSIIVTSGQATSSSFIQMDDFLLQTEQSIEDTTVVVKQVLEINEAQQSLNPESLSKQAKIMISMVPIVALILLSISSVLLFKQKSWENLPQAEKSASKNDDIGEVETQRILENESVFSSSKFAILAQRIQPITLQSLKPKLHSAFVLLTCFTLPIAFTQVNNLILAIILSYIMVLLLESLFTFFERLTFLKLPMVIFMSLCLVIEPFAMTLGTFNLSQDQFIKWTVCSCSVLMMSAVLQDLVVVPIVKWAFKVCKKQN